MKNSAVLKRIGALFLFGALLFSGAVFAARFLQCTEYVAEQLGFMNNRGNAEAWWTNPGFTTNGYTKTSTPQVGAIIVFDDWDYVDSNGKRRKNPYGHVGIVRQIVSGSEIKIDHANWKWDGNVQTGVGVKQAAGSWNSVKVKYNPGDENYGASVYPVQGFLIPPPPGFTPIGISNPSFKAKCISQYPWDAACVVADISFYLDCLDTSGGYSDLCDFGMGGGDYSESLPDFILNKVWLVNPAGKLALEFHPGESIQMKGQVKNTGSGNSSAAITVKFYLSNGVNVDPNKQQVGSNTIQAYNLNSGSTHTETEGTYAPTTLGTYNITVCADTGNVVAEEHESNNCSKEAVFKVVRRTKAERKKFRNLMNQIIND